jgi:hypothetical protein
VGDRRGDGEGVCIGYWAPRFEVSRLEDASFAWKVHRESAPQFPNNAASSFGTSTTLNDLGHLAEVDPAHKRARRHRCVHSSSPRFLAFEPSQDGPGVDRLGQRLASDR